MSPPQESRSEGRSGEVAEVFLRETRGKTPQNESITSYKSNTFCKVQQDSSFNKFQPLNMFKAGNIYHTDCCKFSMSLPYEECNCLHGTSLGWKTRAALELQTLRSPGPHRFNDGWISILMVINVGTAIINHPPN